MLLIKIGRSCEKVKSRLVSAALVRDEAGRAASICASANKLVLGVEKTTGRWSWWGRGYSALMMLYNFEKKRFVVRPGWATGVNQAQAYQFAIS